MADSVRIKFWDRPGVDYIKMTYGDWDGDKTEHSKLLLTGAFEVMIFDPKAKNWTSFPVEYIEPVDVIGAGDVFTSVFITLLLEGWLENDAVKEAIFYASESVKHRGCAIPVRDEERTPKIRNL